jgi:hypothetical protein
MARQAEAQPEALFSRVGVRHRLEPSHPIDCQETP